MTAAMPTFPELVAAFAEWDRRAAAGEWPKPETPNAEASARTFLECLEASRAAA